MNRIEVRNEGQYSRVKIRGAFDETVNMPDNLNCKTVIVDLDELTTFNSVGVRTWLSWLRAKKGFENVRLENCRPRFIKQAVLVVGVIPAFARVDSFYVPFYAPDTQEQIEVKLTFGKEYDDAGLRLPDPAQAGRELELDVDDSYFSFLKKT